MIDGLLPVLALSAAVLAFLWADLEVFARNREPSFREAVAWSLGWLGVALLATPVIWALSDAGDAALYTTVYFIERSLSLDNLFVFVLLFAYFAVPEPERARLLFWGILFAIVLRGLAILGGVALIERFHFVIYVLGAMLLVLAYRMFRTDTEEIDPGDNLMVRLVRRMFPVATGHHGRRWFVLDEGRLHVTPLFLCLTAIVFADIAFAIDSIPAAFGITRDPFLIWMGNAFALLGLRALFVLVDALLRRFRYLDETIALLLGVVAVKLLVEDFYKLSAGASLALIVVLLAGGIALSVWAERREARASPHGAG